MIWWTLVIFGKNRDFGLFWGNQLGTNGILKIDLEVVETFWDRFWKGLIVYFKFLTKNLNFERFCNPNGIHQIYRPKRNMDWYLPFWVLKSVKIEKFVDAINIFGKYESSAFQNRAQNILSTSGYDFMPFWSLVKNAKK